MHGTISVNNNNVMCNYSRNPLSSACNKIPKSSSSETQKMKDETELVRTNFTTQKELLNCPLVNAVAVYNQISRCRPLTEWPCYPGVEYGTTLCIIFTSKLSGS